MTQRSHKPRVRYETLSVKELKRRSRLCLWKSSEAASVRSIYVV